MADYGAGASTPGTKRVILSSDSPGGSGGGGTQYTEDAPAAADPIGTAPILVRKDVPSATVSADGDNIAQRGTNKGEAYTHDADLLTAVAAVETAITNSSAPTGTAGAASNAVLSVQGIVGMTPVTTANTPLTNLGAGKYETVAASQTAQALGPTGATGDYISGVLVVPATTSPGNVLLLDNATSITIFVGGASSVSNLVPFFIPLGMISVSGAWKLTTGANVSCIGIGNFT